MKKLLAVLLVLLAVTGCTPGNKNSENALKFKEDYESLNGLSDGYGGTYRVIEINEDNPFVYVTIEDVVAMMNSGKSFIVYFGSNWCPWCRSVLPYFVETCKKLKVDTVYYVDVRIGNDMDKDIRDAYSLNENNEVYLSHEGPEAYHQFIKMASDVLDDYSRSDVETLDETPFEGAKRVGAPNFVIIKDGKSVKMSLCVPESLDDPSMELTDKIINDIGKSCEEFLNE